MTRRSSRLSSSKIAGQPDIREKFAQLGLDTVAGAPEELHQIRYRQMGQGHQGRRDQGGRIDQLPATT
jgi:hypothetical protein